MLFFFTVEKQNKVLESVDNPDHEVIVTAQQWSWTFNYQDEPSAGGEDVYDAGHQRRRADLVAGRGPERDVHPALAGRHPLLLGAVLLLQARRPPGPRPVVLADTERRRATSSAGAPSCAGSSTRGCCSTSTSSTQEEFDQHMAELVDRGQTGTLLGGVNSDTVAGLEETRGGLTNDRDRRRAHRTRDGGPDTAPTKGQILVRYITTTDHKVIGNLYLATSFAFFLVGGLMAMVIRAELAQPGLQFVDDEVYNQLFTMHGTIMLLLFATPLFVGFANCIMPLQIGAPDVAFPRLNMFSYWLFLFGGLITLSGFIVPGGAADFGWTGYTPLSDAVRSPGVGGDLWVMGLWMVGLGTILGGVNFVTTIICMRAPGMTMFRMPIFTWNILVTSLLVLIAFPIFAGALLCLEADRCSARTSSTRPTAARSSGSTCSGSSATPRSTSSRCRSSASSPRSSRCSAASRSSATSAWSARP